MGVAALAARVASAAVGAMSFLVPTKPVQPLIPPQRGASPRTCTHPMPPRNPPLQGRRASDPSTDPHDSQSKEASQSKNQPPLLPPDPLQKPEKKVKDNLKWRIN